MKKIFTITMLLVAILAMTILPKTVLAHERQIIQIGDKDYLFIIGSLNEPIVVDDKTGVELRVLLADPNDPSNSKAVGAKPVVGLESTLKVEISADGEKKVLDLKAAWQDPGAYYTNFYPTTKTIFTYRFFGEIAGVPVDIASSCYLGGHKVTDDDKTIVKLSDNVTKKLQTGVFGCPLDKAELGFPKQSITLNDLNNTLGEQQKDFWRELSQVPVTIQNFKINLAIFLGLVGLIISSIVLIKKNKK